MYPKTLLLVGALVCAADAAPVAAQAFAPPADSAAFFSVQRHGSGRPMILIPGLVSSGDVWEGTVRELSAGHDMHVLTLAGFAGQPAIDTEPFLAGVRDAIVDYIRRNDLDRPVLVGHSLGAFLALWIAATAPELVGPVVAVDGVPYISALADTTMTPERAAQQAAALRTVFGGLSQEALAAQTRMSMTAQVRDTSWQRIASEWGARSDARTAGIAVAEMMTTDIRGEIARIRTPVLLFMASDGMTPDMRERVRSLYAGQLRSVPAHRVVVAENARHFIMLDDPDFFHAALRSFLNDHE